MSLHDAELIKAWDPDFTKVMPEEAQRIKAAEESGFVADSDIDWDNLQCHEAGRSGYGCNYL